MNRLPRARSGLSPASCPACSSGKAGASSARTFSTQTKLPVIPRPPHSNALATRAAFQATFSQTVTARMASAARTRGVSSTAGRLADGVAGEGETAEEHAERLAQQELDEMEQLMKQFEEQQSAHHNNSAPVGSASSADGHSASSSPATVDRSADEPTTEPKPTINPFSLLRPSFPAGPPTISDLNSLRPKHFTRPDASSAESLRILYAKSWTAGLNNLNSAFKKSQLIKLVTLPTEQGGLELKHDDARLKSGIKINKRTKYWKPKKFEMMSKRELTQSIMVLEWGLVDPETLPKAKIGPSVIETMPLSDRSLFLLLSPNSTTLVNLSRTFGVKASFTRDPETQALMLSLRGAKASVQQAKEEITTLPELSPQQEFELPRPATTLRPEVFQAVSRLSKTFLEPGSEPNALAATAIDKHSIDRAERLLNTAFTSDAVQSSHRTFASLPTSLDSLEYSLFPFVPANPAPWTAGAANSFARVQAVSLAPLPGDAHESEAHASHAAALEFQSWAAKLKIDKTTRLPLSQDGPKSALPALVAPFLKEMKEGERLEMKASFGHIVWPVYPPTAQPTATQEVDALGLGPVLEGKWTFDKFAKWRNQLGPETNNPFAAIMTDLDAADLAEDPNVLPRIDSEEFRQVVYRPLQLPAEGEANERIEVEYEAGAGVIRRSKIKENRVTVMVPNGASDFQVSLTHTTEIAPHAVSKLPSASASAPLLIHLDATPYILATDRHVRRTFILPPVTPTRSLAKDESPPLPRIQERWSDNLFEEGRGAEVSLLVGEGKGDNFWAGRWKDGIRECEMVALKGKTGGPGAAVFGRGR